MYLDSNLFDSKITNYLDFSYHLVNSDSFFFLSLVLVQSHVLVGL